MNIFRFLKEKKISNTRDSNMPSELEVKEFVTRIAQIPPVEDEGEGFDAIHKIGEEINARWGMSGMKSVMKYYREHIPRNSATVAPMIDAIWDGIGMWRH